MKKILLVLALSAASFAASASEKQRITVYWSVASGPERLAFKRFISPFINKHPEIDVTVRYFTTEEFKQNFETWLTDGGDADALYSPAGENLKSLIRRDLVADLTPLWEKNQWQHAFSAASMATASYEGKAYAVPLSFYPWGFFYKRSLFKRLNLSPPETWEEFLALCAKLKANNIHPIATGTKNLWPAAAWFDYFNQRINSLDFHQQLLLGQHSFKDKRVVKALEHWKQLVDANYYTPNRRQKTHRNAIPYLLHEKAGLMLSGSFILNKINPNFGEDIGFFRFPDIIKNKPYTEDAPLDLYIMSKHSKNIEATHRFLEYLASNEAQTLYSEHNRTLPARISSQKAASPFKKAAYKLLNNAAEYAQYFDRDALPEIKQAGLEGFADFLEDANIEMLTTKLETARQRDLKQRNNSKHN